MQVHGAPFGFKMEIYVSHFKTQFYNYTQLENPKNGEHHQLAHLNIVYQPKTIYLTKKIENKVKLSTLITFFKS